MNSHSNYFNFACGLLLLLAFEGIHCGMIPALSVKKSEATNATNSDENDSTEGTSTDKSYDVKRLNCMWLAYEAMLTGDEKYITNECVSLFRSPTNSEWKDDSSESSDLQDELHEMTSQLKAIQSDYDATEKSPKEETDQNASQSNEKTISKKSDESNVEDENDFDKDVSLTNTFAPDGIDAPFVTSVKEINEDFLVIPIKYLKSKLTNDERALSNVDDDVLKDENRSQFDDVNEVPMNMNNGEKENDKDENELDTNENSESINDDGVSNLAKALLTLQNAQDSDSDLNFDVLHQVQEDIVRLEHDLKMMEGRS